MHIFVYEKLLWTWSNTLGEIWKGLRDHMRDSGQGRFFVLQWDLTDNMGTVLFHQTRDFAEQGQETVRYPCVCTITKEEAILLEFDIVYPSWGGFGTVIISISFLVLLV